MLKPCNEVVLLLLVCFSGTAVSCDRPERRGSDRTDGNANHVSGAKQSKLLSELSSLQCKFVYPTIGRTSNEQMLGVTITDGVNIADVFAALREASTPRTIVDMGKMQLRLTNDLHVPSSVAEMRMWKVRLHGTHTIYFNAGLRYFAVHDCTFPEKSTIHFREPADLRILNISGTVFNIHQVIGLDSLVSIEKLLLDRQSSGLITGIPSLNQCRQLTLEGKSVESSEVNRLISGNCVLQFVCLPDTQIDDSTLILLSRIRTIDTINVEGTQATAKGVGALLAIPRLSFLDVRGVRVDPSLIDQFDAKGVKVR